MIKGLPLKVGIGGPVGAGKTSLTEMLCRNLSSNYSMAVITNDIYTAEDAEYLMRKQVLPLERIRGIETGGCPHTAISCLLYTSPSPRDRQKSRMPSSA